VRNVLEGLILPRSSFTATAGGWNMGATADETCSGE
jgi:hypothetical protein